MAQGPEFSLRSLLTFDPIHLKSWRTEEMPISPHTKLANFFGQDVIFHSVEHGGRHLTPDNLNPYRVI